MPEHTDTVGMGWDWTEIDLARKIGDPKSLIGKAIAAVSGGGGTSAPASTSTGFTVSLGSGMLSFATASFPNDASGTHTVRWTEYIQAEPYDIKMSVGDNGQSAVSNSDLDVEFSVSPFLVTQTARDPQSVTLTYRVDPDAGVSVAPGEYTFVVSTAVPTGF